MKRAMPNCRGRRWQMGIGEAPCGVRVLVLLGGGWVGWLAVDGKKHSWLVGCGREKMTTHLRGRSSTRHKKSLLDGRRRRSPTLYRITSYVLPSPLVFTTNMRSLKRRRNLDIVLAFASVFGGSADHSHSVVAVVAAEEEEATAEHQHKDLIERYLQAISEQDDPGAAAVVGVSEENESCFAGWDASCQDNPSFRSVMGASCRTHIPFECTMLHAIGYNEQEVYDVINNCPCACKVPCGQWTFTPSAEPSSSPSSTPSASPRCGTFDIFMSTSVLIFGKMNVCFTDKISPSLLCL